MNVLDHGEVLLLDCMAGDAKVYGAARISTGKRPEEASKGEEADRKLIGFLMANGHGTPFEHAVFQFYVKAPIFVVREWQRHRMASYNEQSGRYSEFQPEFYVPDHIRVQDPKNKQSSVRATLTSGQANRADNGLIEQLLPDNRQSDAFQMADLAVAPARAFDVYQELLARGVAREMARLVLPVSMYTSMWWTVNARSLMNFLALRNSEAAQWEIRQYAEALELIFQNTMPWTHAAFVENGRKAP